MEYVTFILAELGIIAIVTFVISRIHRLTRKKDDFFGGVLLAISFLFGAFVIGMMLFPIKRCTIDLIPSNAKNAISKLENENDSLKVEISIYKGMSKDVNGWDLNDDVFYSDGVNPKYYHLVSDCPVLTIKRTKIKVEKMEQAIDEGKIACGVCGKGSE